MPERGAVRRAFHEPGNEDGARGQDGTLCEIAVGESLDDLLRERPASARVVITDSTVRGGVVCDVAAFAASTWMRGIGFGLVPTTLMAQVDAGSAARTASTLR